MILSIDFETRSVTNLRLVGAHRYAADLATDVQCMAWALDDAEPELWVPEHRELPTAIQRHIRTGGLIFAWNAGFERAIWEAIMVPRYHAPAILPEQWVCTAALAARAGLPRNLKDAAAVLGLLEQKDEQGGAVMRRLHDPYAPDCWWTPAEQPEWFQRMYDYCKQDVRVERAIKDALPRVGHPMERRAFLLDAEINWRGVRIDASLARNMVAIAEADTERINTQLVTVTDGMVSGVTKVDRLRRWTNSRGIPVDSLDKSSLRDLLARPDLPADVREALSLRQEGGKSSLAKLTRMLECAGTDNRIRDMLLYYGADTGRWAGRGVQPQNFPRGEVKVGASEIELLRTCDAADLSLLLPEGATVMALLASALRGCFIPAEGKDFVAADFSAIEARVLAWLAGARTLLRQFREGKSPYPPMGVPIFGHECPKDGDVFQYQVCKNTVLGCGYQMGPETFARQAREQTGLVIPEEIAQRAVRGYREIHHEIPVYWKAHSCAVQSVVREHVEEWYAVGGVAYRLDESGWLTLRLPSGRKLWYPSPRMSKQTAPWVDNRTGKPAIVPCVTVAGVNQMTHKWGRYALYGGLLTENIVQATARDLMVEAMFRTEKLGYETVLTLHDEILAEVRRGHGSVEEFTRVMSAVPLWATGCPVAAEGWRGERWRK